MRRRPEKIEIRRKSGTDAINPFGNNSPLTHLAHRTHHADRAAHVARVIDKIRGQTAASGTIRSLLLKHPRLCHSPWHTWILSWSRYRLASRCDSTSRDSAKSTRPTSRSGSGGRWKTTWCLPGRQVLGEPSRPASPSGWYLGGQLLQGHGPVGDGDKTIATAWRTTKGLSQNHLGELEKTR